MTSTNNRTRHRSNFEDHAQTVIATVMIALITGTGGMVWFQGKDVSAIKEKVDHIQKRQERFGQKLYTQTEAEKDWRIQDQVDMRQNDKINTLSSRMDSHLHQIRDLREFTQNRHDGQVSESRE